MAGYDKRRSHNLQSPSSSGTATPEQINRLRELETGLEESLRAHRETKSTAEMQAQEVEKHFREKLEQLENDYQSAVHYVKGTEKLLKQRLTPTDRVTSVKLSRVNYYSHWLTCTGRLGIRRYRVGLFLYQAFNACDGKQARRTRQSEPLGELFDHGVDAMNTTREVVMFAGTMNLGHSWLAVLALFARDGDLERLKEMIPLLP
ncbi:hypothetical protein B9Z19DRAFT_1129130 [Tuber borchii]|uniref:Uncharacterized protein n=1 Tax=Tuber borchii TaxID=42251 RepID=A0A2T6ZMV9_TUBBO|nr:hypothetical protein B9Z19DRAFT_1129130 [Tuber borchii]